jgi:hypothetical protein
MLDRTKHAWMMRRTLATALAAVLILLSCTQEEPRQAGGSERRRQQSENGIKERRRTRMGVRVENDAFGSSARLVRRAVRDLKRLDLWRPLTDHLYVIEVGSRLGRDNVPRDGHLADAYITGLVEEEGAGALCDILFFPTAITDDLARWRTYHANGYLEAPPPTLRQFWAGLLAHELGHCMEGPRGERVAERWERRALHRFEARLKS